MLTEVSHYYDLYEDDKTMFVVIVACLFLDLDSQLILADAPFFNTFHAPSEELAVRSQLPSSLGCVDYITESSE